MNMDFFTSLDLLGKTFLFFAAAGTLFFVVRLFFMFSGGDIEDGLDVEDGIDGDSADSSDAAFQMFSINSITAFVMMFGWAGLTGYVQFSLGGFRATFIAFMVGVLSMFATAYLFKAAAKLTHKGSDFKIERTVGLNATVYQKIPADGQGKITINIPGGISRELAAVSEDKEDIDSFKTVTVVAVVDPSTLSVRKV